MHNAKKVILIVLDGFGAGALPDAHLYGDAGSHTIDNTSRAVHGLDVSFLVSLGLGLIEGIETVEKTARPVASYGRMKAASAGKDTSTGHWEMAGIILDKPFAAYPEGFPVEMMDRFVKETGYGWLSGMPASGTEVIDRFGEEHLKTKKLIVYTSADSVFQIAAHEDVISLKELYRVSEKARRFLYDFNVGRVIARPFTGVPGAFKRTPMRKDYSIAPPDITVLDRLQSNGIPVVAIGKVDDIFVHRGISLAEQTKDDMYAIARITASMKRMTQGLIFANLNDLDTLYGHRNDAAGYAQHLRRVDERLRDVARAMTDGDVLFITADHGCDPTTPSTDHSREYAPILAYRKGKPIKAGVNLGTRDTFADIGATIAEIFDIGVQRIGMSFLREIL